MAERRSGGGWNGCPVRIYQSQFQWGIVAGGGAGNVAEQPGRIGSGNSWNRKQRERSERRGWWRPRAGVSVPGMGGWIWRSWVRGTGCGRMMGRCCPDDEQSRQARAAGIALSGAGGMPSSVSYGRTICRSGEIFISAASAKPRWRLNPRNRQSPRPEPSDRRVGLS